MNDAKMFLMKIRVYNSLIDSKLDEISHLRSLVGKVTAAYSGDTGGGSGNPDKFGDAIAKIVDLETALNADIDTYVNVRQKAKNTIDLIPDVDQATVLYKRYFEFKKWEQIACEMSFTYRWVLKLHGRALQSLDLILKERKKH